MNIGEASRHSNLPKKTIRYYEEIGLVTANRQENGYRDYGVSHIHKLTFVQRARGLGFSIDECRNLLSLYEDKSRASAHVKAMAMARVTEIDSKLAELQGLRETLAALINACHGDDRPDCPILEDLAGQP